MEDITGLNAKLTSVLVSQHLLAAADRYSQERLNVLCEANVCINTVATTLALSKHHHCTQLKSVCMRFVARPENLRAVMQADGRMKIENLLYRNRRMKEDEMVERLENGFGGCAEEEEPVMPTSVHYRTTRIRF